MSRRPHHYDPDARGGIRRSYADAVADRSALDTGSKTGRWVLGLWALVPTAIALTGIIAGQFLGWLP